MSKPAPLGYARRILRSALVEGRRMAHFEAEHVRNIKRRHVFPVWFDETKKGRGK